MSVENEIVKRVLCDSGEEPLDVCMGETIGEIVREAGHMLDKACLTNVVVVRTVGGDYYVGEFSFAFRKLAAREAKRTARAFRDQEALEE